jgi:hypothetical protein
MAQFKINLLTSVIINDATENKNNNKVKYLETPISEFYDQVEVELSKQNE